MQIWTCIPIYSLHTKYIICIFHVSANVHITVNCFFLLLLLLVEKIKICLWNGYNNFMMKFIVMHNLPRYLILLYWISGVIKRNIAKSDKNIYDFMNLFMRWLLYNIISLWLFVYIKKRWNKNPQICLFFRPKTENCWFVTGKR